MQDGPAGAQKPGACAQEDARKHEQMYLPFRTVQGQNRDRQKGRDAEPQVRPYRQPGMGPAQRAQDIVVQPQRQAQGPGAEELQRLGLQGVFHQPSSLRRKPPSGRFCS